MISAHYDRACPSILAQYRLNVAAPSPGALYDLEVEIGVGVGVGKTSYGGIYLQAPEPE